MVKPISKHEAITGTSKQVEELVDRLVTFINSRLINFVAGSSKSIDVDRVVQGVDSEVRTKALQKVVQVYEALEWKVRIDHGSQRDPGTYLTFS